MFNAKDNFFKFSENGASLNYLILLFFPFFTLTSLPFFFLCFLYLVYPKAGGYYLSHLVALSFWQDICHIKKIKIYLRNSNLPYYHRVIPRHKMVVFLCPRLPLSDFVCLVLSCIFRVWQMYPLKALGFGYFSQSIIICWAFTICQV